MDLGTLSAMAICVTLRASRCDLTGHVRDGRNAAEHPSGSAQKSGRAGRHWTPADAHRAGDRRNRRATGVKEGDYVRVAAPNADHALA